MSWSFHDRRVAVLAGSIRTLPLAACAMSTLAAAQTVPRLEVDVRALASDNPFLLPGTDRAAIQSEVSFKPGLTLTTPTGSTFDLAAVITDRQYSRRYGNFVTGSVDATGTYRDSEYLSLTAGLSTARNLSVDLLTTEVDAAADPRSIRTSYKGALSLTWRPDEYTWIRPDVIAEKTNYADTGLLRDTRTLTTSIAYIRRASERTRIGARAGAIFSRTGEVSNLSTQSLQATFEQQLSAGWRASGELGAERNSARGENWVGFRIDQPARVAASGKAELCRDAPEPAICLSASLNSEVSGLGGLQRRAVIAASARKALNERVTVDFTGEYRRATIQGGPLGPLDAIRMIATVEQKLDQRFTIAGTLQYLRRQLLNGSRIGAGFLGIELRYRPVLR